MQKLVWSEEYSLDIGAIDEQHKALILLANAMQDAVENDRKDEIVEETVEDLMNYAAVHFASEEALLQEVGYPRLDAHKKEHATLAGELVELKQDLALGFAQVAREISGWVWRRIIPHFLESDKAAADWIRASAPHALRTDCAA